MTDSVLRTPAQVLFRCLQPQDAVQVCELRHRAIRECAHQFGTPPDIELARGAEYYRRQLLQGRSGRSKAILGGWVGDSLICMSGIRRRRTLQGPVGLITSMYVTPDWRRCGVGELLLQQSMERIESIWKLTTFHMNVEVNNTPALELYQRNGFEILRREEHAFSIEGTAHSVFLLERGRPRP